ncbi:aldehyde dehydrogenase [Neorhizobium galegae]|uniref:aldehyde dehydrogenase n=1 Tax=Neorhizobium galegae TaxID=399 RepID=UPI00127C4E45|nr:aldehyde dehydrogenase [Neorhizobium galegae]KAA9382366.1 aldehyde dehydrogenase [Neorhizobium galegae]KAB1109667.1 aldehyde dehydrogenase [Neorhizobium galegae]MCM2501654.1 aldehyde dehydrogenase [Neorhizobium galegae]MCQ1775336.1 aldehyde dehydrogenase [Neorhizobium galegae]
MSIRSLDFWTRRATELKPDGLAFIAGRFVQSASGKTYENRNPATNGLINLVAECGQVDVDGAVSVARAAFEAGVWSRRSPTERKRVLLRLADLIERDLETIALLESLDMGKPVQVAFSYELPDLVEYVRWFAESIDKIYDEIAPAPRGNLALIRREAVGVVAAVVPWNFPLDMAVWKCIPALAAGNSVILKPAEQSPLTALHLARLIAEAGVPDGVFNVLPGFGAAVGQPLGLHMDVDCLAFTGSTEVGKRFLSYSAQSNMKLAWLECGGKSPNIIFDDTDDLDAAAELAARVHYNQGEICSSPTRLIVQKGVHDAFLEKVIAHSRAYAPGNPLDPNTLMGSMVDAEHCGRVMSYIEKGRAEASLVLGGNRVTIGSSENFIEPTIFAGVTPGHIIAQEEIFGPVLSVLSFETEAEAVRMANDSIYGLMASVFTSNLSRAHRMSESLRAGTVAVNTVDLISPLVPFGGMRQSGNGRDNSLHAFEKYTQMKTTWIKF